MNLSVTTVGGQPGPPTEPQQPQRELYIQVAVDTSKQGTLPGFPHADIFSGKVGQTVAQ